uniref:Major facilitator superfamily (MFS) profile domain-containing protein n=1 Tax=Timema douglasi TaxID=61478 RepID=A0A7R8Z794_TIMDO|nr:unnamed protein product [Timema douglasi]
MIPLLEKLRFLYQPYVLLIVSLSYMIAEVGHFMIGVTSKATAKDLHYGDISCQFNNTDLAVADIPIHCESVNESSSCAELSVNGTPYCEWTYNGLGIDYQILAGPSFIAVYTIMGVILGIVADKYNRVWSLSICTLVLSLAIILSGAVKEYWQLVVLRLLLAAGEAGCNPMATGLLSDIFPENKRGLVMSIFNWGIYGGYGIDFPIGRYIPKLDLWGLGWRVCYYGAGIVGLIITFLMAFTVKEPERKAIGEESTRAIATIGQEQGQSNKDNSKDWKSLLQPRVIILCLAASIRHTDKTVTEIMKFLEETDLAKEAFQETYKLCCLISTIPVSTSTVERTFSCLKRIKTTVRNTQCENRLSTLSLLSVEKGLLNELQSQKSFYDAVIDKFIHKGINVNTFPCEMCRAESMYHWSNGELVGNDISKMYFPHVDLGWWLFIVTFGIGSIGVVVGGVVSDKFVAKMGIRSRVAVLAISQLCATPGAFGSVYAEPTWAMITLGISYFFAEMWFGIVFAILVEIIPLSMRSTAVGVFLFVMNNIGGNLPILVDPISKMIGYRESLYIFYVGAYLLSSLMFLGTMFMMDTPYQRKEPKDRGHENGAFTLERIGNNGAISVESSKL